MGTVRRGPNRGSCNAVRRRDDGTLQGDLFDGEGFVRAARQRLPLNGCDALVIGCGGVGAAIAASLAQAGVKHLTLFDPDTPRAQELADRLKARYAALSVTDGTNDPTGHGVVNASPLGRKPMTHSPWMWHGWSPPPWRRVVLSTDVTPYLRGAPSAVVRFSGHYMLYTNDYGFRIRNDDFG